MNPEQKRLALELLDEAQQDLEPRFDLADLNRLLSLDALSSDQMKRDLRKAINEIIG